MLPIFLLNSMIFVKYPPPDSLNNLLKTINIEKHILYNLREKHKASAKNVQKQTEEHFVPSHSRP